MVFLCTLSIAGRATDYYVSSSGSDSANGLSSSTPWQSISKVNSAFSVLSPGDRILFKRGDRFYGSLQISRSGSSGSPITISSYGTGANPVLSGFTRITGWSNYGGGIYSKIVACQSGPNMVTVNDINTPIGRWPNTGFLTIDSHVSKTSINDASLPSSPNWAGAEVVIRKNWYIWDRNKITNHSGTTLTYLSSSDYNAIDGYGYFIQNDIRTLDQLGEWYYNGNTFFMYFGSASPDNYIVKVSTVDKIFNLDSKKFITIDNIAIEGANKNALYLPNTDHITIQNTLIDFTGETAIFGPWSASPGCKITNTCITHSNSSGIKLLGYFSDAIITNNIIRNTGLIIGMGGSGDGTYNALELLGHNGLIQSNVIENSGYIGITFRGNNTLVANNYINKFNLVKNDGGGIYSCVGPETPCSGQKIISNIILNGIGFTGGSGDPANNSHGIYLDDGCEGIIVTDNSVAHCSVSGILLHNAHEIEVRRNTFYDNGSGNLDYGSQILIVHDEYGPNDPIRNITLNSNIFFARTKDQKVLCFSTPDNDISVFGTSDYNCFAKPIDNNYVSRSWVTGWYGPAVNRTLSEWQAFSGKDANSFKSPLEITDINKIRFECNESNSNKIVSLDVGYLDVKGTKYSGSVTLLPYSSVVLIVDPNPSAPPPIVTPPVVVTPPVTPNTPPVVVVNYTSNSYSGFVNEIDASGSYDLNNDNLSFTWSVPGNVPVSSINESKIKFLSPIVSKPQTVVFALNISDGKITQSKFVPVEILPYQQDLEVAEIANIEASGFQSPDYPLNILDGDIGTMWSTNGDNQWIILELKEPFNIQHVRLAFKSGQIRESYFDILGSKDKITWEPILTKSASCAFSGDLQVFDLPPSKSGEEFNYVKLIGQGNSLDNWNYISEFRIFGYRHKNPSNYENLIVKIYPNPAHEIVNILIDDPSFNPDFVNIVSLTGKILYTEKIESGTRQFQVPLKFKEGIYIVQMGTDEMTMFTQKLVISR